jgi:hypothetical protein
MEYLIAFALGVIGSLIASELYAGVRPISACLIDWAATRFPEHAQARFREEWHAHLIECAGNLRGLLHALGCAMYAVIFTCNNVYEDTIRRVLEATFYELALHLAAFEEMSESLQGKRKADFSEHLSKIRIEIDKVKNDEFSSLDEDTILHISSLIDKAWSCWATK